MATIFKRKKDKEKKTKGYQVIDLIGNDIIINGKIIPLSNVISVDAVNKIIVYRDPDTGMIVTEKLA